MTSKHSRESLGGSRAAKAFPSRRGGLAHGGLANFLPEVYKCPFEQGFRVVLTGAGPLALPQASGFFLALSRGPCVAGKGLPSLGPF
jgi:hypothetical protein